MESSHDSKRPDRKTVEKNRRIHMKALCSKLESLLPNSPTSRGVTLPLPDRLDEAVNYIKGQQGRLERMKERKRQLMGSETTSSRGMGSEVGGGMRVPQIEVQDLGPALRVVLISSPVDRHMFYEAIRVLEEEGGVVLNANLSVVGDKAFHIIHSMVADPSGGSEAGKVLERLKKACCHC